MSEGGSVHHRVVIAIEATALAVPYLPVFKRLVVHQLIQHLKLSSFEVALVTFATRDGTARCCLTTTPWTCDVSVLDAWLNALPAILEGTGNAAAQEALAEALSMLEQPSELTPVDESAEIEREIVMLWLSDGPFTSSLVISPDSANSPQLNGYRLPLTMIAAPRMSFSAFTPNHLGSKRSLAHIEGEHNNHMAAGAQKESLFSVVLCSCVPEMVANIMHGSSQAAVSRAIVAAIRRQIVSDPELRKQHKAAAAIYRPRVAAPTQAADTAKRSAQQVGQPDAETMPASKVARTTGAVMPRSTLAIQPMRTAAAPTDTTAPTDINTVPNTAVPMNQTDARKKVISWQGSVVGNEMGVPQTVIRRGELAVMAADRILTALPSPVTWPQTIDLLGTIKKITQFSQAVQTMGRELYGKVLVKFDAPTLKGVYARHQAEVIVLSPCTGHAIVIPHTPLKSTEPVRLGLYMTEATRAKHFPFMQKL